MATGYTHCVVEGQVTDFATFCLQCARAFGACIMQRDDSTDAPPELPKLDTYHDERLDEARSALKELNLLSDEQWRERFSAAVAEAKKDNEERENRTAKALERLVAMRNAAESWRPPTDDHKGLKKFMLEQLDTTIEFDGKTYLSEVPNDFDAWKVALLSEAVRDIEYHKKHAEEDRQRHRDRCEWITKLYQSLGREVKAAA